MMAVRYVQVATHHGLHHIVGGAGEPLPHAIVWGKSLFFFFLPCSKKERR